MKKSLGLLSFLAMGALAPVQANDVSCCNAPGKDFPKVGGNYGNQNYTALSQINKATISRLGAVWHDNLEGGSKSTYQQASVVVVDGVIFAETSQGNVYAVDGKTGQIKWSYKGGFGTQFRRGLAVGDGKVYAAFGGFHIAALDQKTGALIWQNQVLKDDVTPGFVNGSLKTAIVYYDGLLYFGTADSSRGAAWAVNAGTGAVVWKFFGAPGNGEFGNETWEGDSWKTGGASPWMHPAIDPELGLVYFTFGNARAGAPTDGSQRAGQNLFANSLVALDAKTGKRAWHFQSVHHDIWDMDNVMAPVLADVP
ncbi:MAG TPA: PQQ-binding-like beta-propeller repeat protein, partial [Verrucomicrobiae bacterium]|nr:PQQ-binding-like beta-propeller repeat protein [Verrucomicrobiae bacterium]